MKNPNFSFFLRNMPNPQKLYPIVMSITMGKDRTQVFTGLWVEKSKWNAKLKRIKGSEEQTQVLNDSLLSLLSHARNHKFGPSINVYQSKLDELPGR